MELVRPSPESVPFVVRAMKTVATAAGPLHPGARRLLEAAQDFLVGQRLDLEGLAPITPEELARHVSGDAVRAQIVHGMITLSLVDGIPPRAQTDVMHAFARALGVDDGGVETIEKLVDGHLATFRWCFLRRAHLRDFAASQLRQEGILATIRSVATTFGITEDPKLAARYAGLADLPSGTLGRELHLYYLRNQFPWPGQRRAAPEAIVAHDVTHLLSGYGTDPIGETLVAAFTAGTQRDASRFFTPLIGLVMFSTGVHVIPNPNVPAMHVDAFSQPDVAKRWFRAIERGSRVSKDLTRDVDFWSVAAVPLDELRRRWNVAPE